MKNTILISTLLFLVVFGINVTIRQDVIVNETLIADDLIFMPSALSDSCTVNKRGFIAKSFLCHVVGAKSIFQGRLIFIAYLSLVSVLFFQLLSHSAVHRLIAFLCAVCIFAGIPMLSQTTFLTGSYPLHGLLFTILGIWFASYNLARRRLFPFGYLSFLGLFLLLLFAGVATASNALASFILVPFAVYSFMRRDETMTTLAWVFVSFGPAVLLTALQFSGVFSNHYGKKLGWIEFSSNRILSQISKHQHALDDRIGTLAVYLVLFCLLISIVFYIHKNVSLLRIRNGFNIAADSGFESNRPIVLTGSFIFGFFISLLPSLAVSGSPARYTVIPLFFLFGLSYLLLDHLFKNTNKTIAKVSIVVVSLSSALYSTNKLSQNHNSSFEQRSLDQVLVRDFLFNKAETFAEQAQILIYSNAKAMSFTSGFNHWSTNFSRLASGRQDITALIGQKGWMTDNPFTGEYKNHDPKYWGVRNGRQYRKKMVGLDILRPTYIFEFSNNGFTQLDCIAVNSSNEKSIYYFDKVSGNKVEEETSSVLNKAPHTEIQNCAVFILSE